MDNETRQEIEALKAQVEALTSERIPTVDRASKRRDKRQVFAGFGLFAVAVMIAGTISASPLSGSNTVLSDDIKDTEVHGSDINANAVSGAKIKDGTITNADLAKNKVYTAQVSSTGVRVRGDATSSSKSGLGTYSVVFPFDASKCNAHANAGGFAGADLGVIPLIIGASNQGAGIFAVAMGVPKSTGGLERTNSAFTITLICP